MLMIDFAEGEVIGRIVMQLRSDIVPKTAVCSLFDIILSEFVSYVSVMLFSLGFHF